MAPLGLFQRKLEARMIEEEYERRAEEKRMRKPDPERKVPVSEVGRKLIERVVEGKDKTYREQGNNRWKVRRPNQGRGGKAGGEVPVSFY